MVVANISHAQFEACLKRSLPQDLATDSNSNEASDEHEIPFSSGSIEMLRLCQMEFVSLLTSAITDDENYNDRKVINETDVLYYLKQLEFESIGSEARRMIALNKTSHSFEGRASQNDDTTERAKKRKKLKHEITPEMIEEQNRLLAKSAKFASDQKNERDKQTTK